MPAVAIQHDVDPREAILAKVGGLDELEIFGSDVVVAIYERPNKTASGIILSDRTLEEDIHQGKIGLIVAMGPMAFVDDDKVQFSEHERCKLHEWVFYRPSDSWRATLNTHKTASSKDNTVNLRIIRDTLIRGRVSNPDLIY